MRFSAKRVSAICGGLLTLISFSRCSVLFLEALSTVRDERFQDTELLELCQSGVARQSAKMRTACLQAQADRASPVILKAVLRAVGMAYSDFTESVSTPGKMLIVVLFAILSIFMPVLSWIRAIIPQEVLMEGTPHVVVLSSDSEAALGKQRLGSLGRKVAGALRLRKPSRQRQLTGPGFDVESDSSFVEIDFQQPEMRAKWE
jgi:hypothetical protein